LDSPYKSLFSLQPAFKKASLHYVHAMTISIKRTEIQANAKMLISSSPYHNNGSYIDAHRGGGEGGKLQKIQ
jgi:hypothetical protein